MLQYNKKFHFSISNKKSRSHNIHTIGEAVVTGAGQDVSALSSLLQLQSNVQYTLTKHSILIDYKQLSLLMQKVNSINDFTYEMDPAQLLDFHDKKKVWYTTLAEQSSYFCSTYEYVHPCVQFDTIAGLIVFEKMMGVMSQGELSSVFTTEFLNAYKSFNAAAEQQSFHDFPFDQQNVRYCLENKTLSPHGIVHVQSEIGLYGSEIMVRPGP